MRDGPVLTVDDSPVRTPASRATARSAAVSPSLQARHRLRTALGAVIRYDSWIWRLALVAGVAAYGLAMAIAMSAHPHI
jgi:hypothetical protein